MAIRLTTERTPDEISADFIATWLRKADAPDWLIEQAETASPPPQPLSIGEMYGDALTPWGPGTVHQVTGCDCGATHDGTLEMGSGGQTGMRMKTFGVKVPGFERFVFELEMDCEPEAGGLVCRSITEVNQTVDPSWVEPWPEGAENRLVVEDGVIAYRYWILVDPERDRWCDRRSPGWHEEVRNPKPSGVGSGPWVAVYYEHGWLLYRRFRTKKAAEVWLREEEADERLAAVGVIKHNDQPNT